MVKAGREKVVEEQIHEALFPRVNIEGALFAAEVAVQGDAWAEGEGFLLQGAVDCRQILRASAGEIVEIFFVGGSEQGFAPGKEGLGVEADGALVEIGFAVEIAPPAFGRAGQVRWRGASCIHDLWCCGLYSGRWAGSIVSYTGAICGEQFSLSHRMASNFCLCKYYRLRSFTYPYRIGEG